MACHKLSAWPYYYFLLIIVQWVPLLICPWPWELGFAILQRIFKPILEPLERRGICLDGKVEATRPHLLKLLHPGANFAKADTDFVVAGTWEVCVVGPGSHIFLCVLLNNLLMVRREQRTAINC